MMVDPFAKVRESRNQPRKRKEPFSPEFVRDVYVAQRHLQIEKEPQLDEAKKEYIFSSVAKANDAHLFSLDVEQAQGLYEEILAKPQIHDSQTGDFVLPFDNCLFAFQDHVKIRWRQGHQNDRPVEYVSKQLIGFLIYQIMDGGQETKELVDTHQNITLRGRLYRTILFFEEQFAGEENQVMGTEHMDTNIVSVIKGNEPDDYLYLGHLDHHPCGNAFVCNVDKKGMVKWPDAKPKKAWVCDEIVVRDAVMELIQKLAEKIMHSTQEVKFVKAPKYSLTDLGDKVLPEMPKGWPYTKGNGIPKDYYTQYIDGKKIKYEDYRGTGMGAKHQYRYDVRRHPRIVKNKIVWVNPYQRGKGRYVPKIYANKKTWFIHYFWQSAEKLTRVRFFELLLIRFLQWRHKHV